MESRPAGNHGYETVLSWTYVVAYKVVRGGWAHNLIIHASEGFMQALMI